jgi:hypothetical protein
MIVPCCITKNVWRKERIAAENIKKRSEHILLLLAITGDSYQEKKRPLLFFAFHHDCFFGAFVGADTASFTVPQIYFVFFADGRLRTVQDT